MTVRGSLATRQPQPSQEACPPQAASPERRTGWRDLAPKLLIWLLGLALVALLVWWVGWEAIGAAIRLADPRILLLLALLQVVTLSLCAGQLWYLLRGAGVALPFRRVLAIYLAGGFVESVTPSVKFGGEAVKVYLLKRHSTSNYQRLAGVFVTYKLASVVPFIVLVSVSAIWVYGRTAINILPYALGAGVALGGFMGWLYARGRRARHGEESRPTGSLARVGAFVSDALAHARNTADAGQLALVLLAATLVWLLYPLKLAIAAASLGLDLAPVPLAAVLYASYLVSMLPLAPGGLGSFEASLTLMLGRLGVLPETAVALTLLLRFATYWFPLLPSGLAAVSLLRRPRAPALSTQGPS